MENEGIIRAIMAMDVSILLTAERLPGHSEWKHINDLLEHCYTTASRSS